MSEGCGCCPWFRHGFVKVSSVPKDTSLADEEGISTAKKDGTIDLIILGPSECGKSTVIRHMVYMSNKGINPQEIPEIIKNIRSNVLGGAQDIIHGMEKLGIPFEIEANRTAALTFKGMSRTTNLNEEQINCLREMLKDHGVSVAMKRVNEFQFNYAFNYYVNLRHLQDEELAPDIVDGLSRVYDPNFTPTMSDAIHMRKHTRKHEQREFVFRGVKFRLTDVGGERQLRPEWNMLMQNALMVIFVASLSDYDLVLREDNRTNRMEEAITLFQIMCTHELLVHKSIFLFLNKLDMFLKKVKRIPVSRYFPNYAGPNEAKPVVNFFKDMFIEASGDKAKKHMLHYATTDATDKTSMEKVFAAVKDTVIQIVARRTLL